MRRAFRRLALALAVLVCRGSVGAAAMQSKGKTSGATQQRVAKNVETSIRSGLGWLIRHQNPDGSWSANSLAAHCTSDPKCDVSKEKYDERLNAGVTALAVLAFLQTGHGPTSDVQIENPVADGATDVGDVVTKALEWLCKRQQLNGQFTPQRAFLYSEALAATALAEGFYRSRDERWKAPAQRAIDFVQSAQRLSPAGSGRWGWRYDSREQVEHDFVGRPAEELKKRVYDADTSVTGWCVRALQSATLAGLDVQPESTAGALAFIRWVSVDNGFVGYIDPKTAGATVTGKNDQFRYHPSVMSALALSVRTSVARDPSDPQLELEASRIIQDLPMVSKDKLSVDYYYWQQGSLALREFDGPNSARKSGKYWKPWEKALIDALIPLQNVEEGTCHRGGWLVLDRWSFAAGPIYTTAINVLTLSLVGK